MTGMIRLVCLLALYLGAAVPVLAATEIRQVTSPGGITAWLVEEPSIPMLAIELDFAGGPALDPDAALGASNLMAGLLEEGAGPYDSLEFARRADALAARYGFGSGRDGISVSATILTENRAESIDLLALALSDPRFSADAVERVRAQVLSGLRSDQTDPNAIAGRRFAELTFPGHPFGRPSDGTLETVAALTRDDLLAAHRRSLARDRVTIGVVGDITAAELGPLLDTLLGGLPETGPPLPPPAGIPDAGQIQVVPFDSPQSVARFGHRGLADNDPDYLAAYVVNQVLGGGGFNSRLTERVREQRGLTYGIYTYLSGDPKGPLILGSVASANGTMSEALALVREIWADIAENGLTEMEFEAARRYLTGAYPLRFDGNRRIANILVGMQIGGQPITYPQERNAMIEALTLEQVNRVAARLLMPENLAVVVVGQPEGMLPTQ